MSDQAPASGSTAVLDTLRAYLPRDRRHALARGVPLPDRTAGTALFADISGFTPLTHSLVQAYGPRRGGEELVGHLNRIYDALIGAVDRFGGTVIGFAGDAITCWFEGAECGVRGAASLAPTPLIPHSALRAVACALAMQLVMTAFDAIAVPGQEPARLALKIAVASGPARRFVVGDPEHMLCDVLAGATLARMATAERLALKGEIVADEATIAALGATARVSAWRAGDETDSAAPRFAVVEALDAQVTETPWQTLPAGALGAEQLRPWLVPAVYARLSSGQGEFLTELRPTVALFLSFAGIDYDGDDDAGAKLDAFVRWVQHVVARYAGTLLQLTIGDKGSYLYVAFGAPLAHEDDLRRALNAALDLRTPPAALDCIQPVRIGVAQGTARTGACGGTTRRTYGALGEHVNLAARLMQAAAPGRILVDGEAQAHVRDAFAWHAVPPLTLKGLAQPVPVGELAGRAAHRELRLQEPHYALAMVGRAEELQCITMLLAQVRATGRGHVIGITAEAGMGKSRLAAEAIARARALGYDAFGGNAVSYGTTTPYLAWRAIVRGLLDLPDEDAPAAQGELLAERLAAVAPDLLPRLPLLGDVLGLALPDNELTAGIEAQARQQGAYALMADLLRAHAGPLLLVLEDAHWLDDLSRDLARYLPGFLAGRPVCFLTLYRPPQAAGGEALWSPAPAAFTEFALAPFSAAESAALVELKLGGHAAPPALLEQIAARAQGNPFFVDEFVNLLQARGLDLAEERAASEIELPDSLERLILSRIDQLAEDERLLLRVASVIGRLFRARWLLAIYPAELRQEVLQASLARLDTTELVALSAEDPEIEYLFKHAITQEAAYATLSLATRRVLHERLAEYLAAAYAANLQSWYGILAYHYQRAERPEQELRYTGLAAAQAGRQNANRQALALYTRAIALAETVPLAPAERFALHAGRFDQLEILGERTRLPEDVPALLALAEQLDPHLQVEALLRQGLAELYLKDAAPAPEIYARAQALVDAHDDLPGRLELLLHRSFVTFATGEYREGKATLRQVIELAGEEYWLHAARAAQRLGWIVYDEGDYGECERLWLGALAQYQAHANLWGEALLRTNLAGLYGTRMEMARALESAERGLALAVKYGYRSHEREALRTLGEIHMWTGNYGPATDYLARALALAEAFGAADMFGRTYVRMCIAEVALETGDVPQAESLSRDALELARPLQGKDALGYILHTRGRVLSRQGRFDEARPLLEESLQLRCELAEPNTCLPTLADLAELHLRRQDWPAARDVLARIRALLFPSEGQAREDVAAGLAGYRILSALGASEEARAWLERTHATLQKNADRVGDAALRASFLTRVSVHRSITEEYARLTAG